MSVPVDFGLGLRPEHYEEIAASPGQVSWFEALSENYMVAGGMPLNWLDRIRRDYPMALHGVSLSIGSIDPLDRGYLDELKVLVERVQPMWVSDHLCFTGLRGQNMHDLLPLPYTEEALNHVAERVMAVQEHLGRRLVLENVSSYVTYAASELTEWDFITELARRADCEILLDVNNVYVSAFNHEFDALAFLRAMPRERVRQFHLAGHTHKGNHIIDTHDEPIVPDVWTLYAEAVRLFPGVPTMIERDANIPPYAELLAELDEARRIAASVARQRRMSSNANSNVGSLGDLQRAFQDYVLASSDAFQSAVRDTRKADRLTLLDVYRDGYALRLIEVLTSDYPGVMAMAGPDDFDHMARAYIARHPSRHPSVRWYGKGLADFLASTPPYNGSPDAAEMARFEWALGEAFNSPDAAAVTADALMALAPEAWETISFTTLPSLRRLTLTFDVPQAWQRRDEVEPGNLEAEPAAGPVAWAIWRPEFISNFRSLESDEAAMLDVLVEGRPFPELCEAVAPVTGEEQAPARAAGLLRAMVEGGMIAGFRT